MHILAYLSYVLCLLSYFCAILAGITGKYNIKEDNISLRDFFAQSTGITKRLNYAQKNSFEVLIVFTIAFFVALHNNVEYNVLIITSLLFTFSRILYIIVYMKNWSNIRSILFFF